MSSATMLSRRSLRRREEEENRLSRSEESRRREEENRLSRSEESRRREENRLIREKSRRREEESRCREEEENRLNRLREENRLSRREENLREESRRREEENRLIREKSRRREEESRRWDRLIREKSRSREEESRRRDRLNRLADRWEWRSRIRIPQNKETNCMTQTRKEIIKMGIDSPNPSVIKMLESLPTMAADVRSDDVSTQLKGMTEFQKLLSNSNQSIPSPFKQVMRDQVIKAGVVPRFVEFLKLDDYPELQFNAASALMNIACGKSEHTKVVMGAVPIFVKLLSSARDDVRQQAVLALGNVAVDSPSCRDMVLDHGGMIPLLSQFKNDNLSILQFATWALSCIFLKPHPSFDQISHALPVLSKLVNSSSDKKVLTYAWWALANLSGGTCDTIQAVIDHEVFPGLVKLLQHPMPHVLAHALQVLINIIYYGDDTQTKRILNNDVLSFLCGLLNGSHEKKIIKAACHNTSIIIIIAKEVDQMEAVMKSGIVRPLVTRLQNAYFEKNSGNSEDVNERAQMSCTAEELEKIKNLWHDDDIHGNAVKILETYIMKEKRETFPDEAANIPVGGQWH